MPNPVWQVNLVAAEMRDPVRDLPRSVHAGIPTVTICFVLTNLAYYIIIPWNVVQESDAIAVVSTLLNFCLYRERFTKPYSRR